MGTGLGTENKIMGYLTNKKIDSVNDKGVYIDGDGLRLRVDNKSNKIGFFDTIFLDNRKIWAWANILLCL